MEERVRPAASDRIAYRFASLTLDLERGMLLYPAGAELRVRPKAFALLRHLVENAGRLIGRDEILAAVWPGVFVTEDSVTLCVRQLRAVLGDAEGRMVRTIRRRGYLFAAAVKRVEAVAAPAPAADASSPERFLDGLRKAGLPEWPDRPCSESKREIGADARRFSPALVTAASSQWHSSLALGRRRRIRLAICRPDLITRRRTARLLAADLCGGVPMTFARHSIHPERALFGFIGWG